MIRIFVSHFNSHKIANAAIEVASRIRHCMGDDPVMMERAQRMEETANAVLAVHEAGDTRPISLEIIDIEDRMEDDFHVITHILEVHMLSPLHEDTADIANDLHRLIAGCDSEQIPVASHKAIRIPEIIDLLDKNRSQAERIGLWPYVEQLRSSHNLLEAKIRERGQLRSEKPEDIYTVRGPLSSVIRTFFGLLAERETKTDVHYIADPLKPFCQKSTSVKKTEQEPVA